MEMVICQYLHGILLSKYFFCLFKRERLFFARKEIFFTVRNRYILPLVPKLCFGISFKD